MSRMVGRLTQASLLLAAAHFAMTPARSFASDTQPSPIVGRWLTQTDHGRVEIGACGDAYCGRIISSDFLSGHPDAKDTSNRNRALRDRPAKGLELLKGFTGGPKVWKGGTVYNPADGGTYSGSIRLLDDDHLKLRGCIIAPFCKSEVWTRVR